MDNEEHRKLLQQLHDEINNTKTIDETEVELLRDLEGDIRALLERARENPVEYHPSFVERLHGAVNRFEVTYPDLTTLISKLLDSLSSAGI
jgi:hypothetical protein